MTSLIIEQSTSATENVNSVIIERLYALALTSTVQDQNNTFQMQLQGNIITPSAYEDSVLYLRQKFPNLTITVQDNNFYIRFMDTTVETVLKNYGIGDGIGITQLDAAAVSFGSLFKDNTTITSFPEFSKFTVQNRGGYSFSGCTNLQNIDLSNLSGTIPNYAFKSCNLGPTISSLGAITEIGIFAFQDNKNLTSVALPNTCITLTRGTFQGCSNLVITPEDLQYIQNYNGNRDTGPFGSTNANTVQITYPDNDRILYLPNAHKLNARTFEYQSMKEVNLPNLTALNAQEVFGFCLQLTKVASLGNAQINYDDCDYLYRGIFQGCTNLEEVNLPSSINIISSNMFRECSSLRVLNLNKENIIGIGGGAFYGCSSLQTRILHLPNLLHIGIPKSSADKQVVPNYVGKISIYAECNAKDIFTGSSLKNLYFPKAKIVTTNCISINGGRTVISEPFNNANLDVLYLKEIQYISCLAFANATINTIIINNTTVPTITDIYDAQSYDSERDRVTSEFPNRNNDIFHLITSISNIYVPDSAVSTYQNSSIFSNWTSIIKPISQCPRKTVQEVESGEIGLIEAYM